MPKSPDAFRTISEVADWLGIQAHVLRFWESKFTQVKPIKRAGGRRYYRPNDMLLLGGIRQLLHEDGLTIKGVQKILREEGMSHVATLSQPLDELTQSQLDDAPVAPMVEPVPAQETGVVLNFESAPAKPETPKAVVEEPVAPVKEDALQQEIPAAEPVPEATQESVEVPATTDVEAGDVSSSEPMAPQVPAEPETTAVAPEQEAAPALVEQEATPAAAEPEETPAPVEQETTPAAAEPEETPAPIEPEEAKAEARPETPTEPEAPEPEPQNETQVDLLASEITSASEPDAPAAQVPETEEAPVAAALPAFLRRPMAEPAQTTDNPPAEAEQVEDVSPPAPKPRVIDMPVLTPVDQIEAAPAMLTSAFRTRSLTTTQAKQIAPLLDKLTILRDSMAARRRSPTNPGPNT